MKRKCTVCNTVTTEDRLVACPECGAYFLSGEPDRTLLTPQQEKYIVAKIWKRHWKFLFGGFSVLTVISVALLAWALIGAYKSGTARLEKTLVDKVSKEFETAQIRAVVSNVAETKAEALLLEQIRPEVETFKTEVASQLSELKSLVADTRQLKSQSDDHAKQIEAILASVQSAQQEIAKVKGTLFGLNSDLVKLERGLVEIQYFTYTGRNRFPNPYHDRIMKTLNELLVIAIPNPTERASVVKELQSYQPKK